MKILKALEKDAEELSLQISEEFPYTEANSQNLKARMKRPVIRLFKCVEKGKIAGFLEMEMLDGVFGVWRINGLAVKKEFRKKGFGEKLAEFAVSFAQKQDATQLLLLVRPDNSIAKKIYSRLGFENSGFWKSPINGKKAEEWVLKLKSNLVS